jgi:ribose 5-phosphate isomerase B
MRNEKKLILASDHAGFEMKEKVKEYLVEKGFEVVDVGTYTAESCDYPDYGHKLAEYIENKIVDRGISFCGSGNGINMTVNKHKDIRAALCWNEEISRLARAHNDANVCSIPARFIDFETAKKIVDTFLNTSFDGGRHLNRINKIPLI